MGLTATPRATVLDDNTLLIDGADTVTTASIDGATYVFVSGGAEGRSVFRLDADGGLEHVENNTSDASDLGIIALNGYTYLISQYLATTQVMLVNSDGTLLTVATETDTTIGVSAAGMETVAFGDTAYLVSLSTVALPGDSIIETHLIDGGDGGLTNIDSLTISDSDQTTGSSVDMATAVVNGSTYIFSAVPRTEFLEFGGPDKLIVHKLSPDGTLSLVDTLVDDTDLALDGVNGVTTARIGLSTYLFVTSATESALTVFLVDTDGSLSEVDRVTNSTVGSLTWPLSTEVIEVDGVTYLAVAASAGLTLFRVADDGSLSLVETLNDFAPDAPYIDSLGYDLAATEVDGTTFLTLAYTFEIYTDDSYLTIESEESGIVAIEIAHDVIDEAPETVSVIEGLTQVTAIETIKEDDTVAFSITGGADAGLFTINSDSGLLSFTNARNFEAPVDTDGDNIYEVEISADDGIVTETKALSVEVTDYLFTNGQTEFYDVAEGEAAVTTFSLVGGTGPIFVGVDRFTITGGPDAALFAVNSSSRELAFVNAPDFENPDDVDGDNVYEIKVNVIDAIGSTTGGGLGFVQTISETITVFVTVSDINDTPPTIISDGGGNTAALNVAENTTTVTTVLAEDPEGSPSYAISGGDDAALFIIDPSTGALDFVAAPDFEIPSDANADNVYQVVVDANEGGLTDSQAISVTITDAAGLTVMGTSIGESLVGSTEDDLILAKNGKDALNGLAGDDLLDGGRKSDLLTGGDGADQFQFSTKLKDKWADTISDFGVDQDTILLDRDIFAKAGKPGVLKAKFFDTGKKADSGRDRILYQENKGWLRYDKDGKGGADAVKFAKVDKNLDLSEEHFLVVA